MGEPRLLLRLEAGPLGDVVLYALREGHGLLEAHLLDEGVDLGAGLPLDVPLVVVGDPEQKVVGPTAEISEKALGYTVMLETADVSLSGNVSPGKAVNACTA